jgi:thiol-disulfide isomerase/thioredoxin
MVKRLAVVACALVILQQPLGAQSAPGIGAIAPVVTVNDLDGKPVRIAVTAGNRAAVVEFWATWCELCEALLPSMKAAHKTYGNQVDFYGVNVTVSDSKDHVKRYVVKNMVPFIPLYDEKSVAIHAFGAVATSYVVIVDRNGKIAYTGSGADQDMSAQLAKVLK